MTNGERDKLSQWAIIALTVISLVAIAAGVVVAWQGSPLEAVAPVVAGAVGGIVAIVLREHNGKGG